MTRTQIQALGPALSGYLGEFADCFVHADTQSHLQHYVRGQLSDLPRKSVEPMAHWAEVPHGRCRSFFPCRSGTTTVCATGCRRSWCDITPRRRTS